VDITTHLSALDNDGTLLADAAEKSGLDAPVPSCPDWNVRELVQHIGQVHRWAHSYVSTGRTTPPDEHDSPATPPGDLELLDWFRAGHRAIVDALRKAPDELVCWAFLPAPSPRAFWARRQAHETAIHRVDLQLAAGYGVSDLEPDFAADGIDELVMGMIPDRLAAATADHPVRVLLEPLDANMSWTVRIAPDGVQVARQVCDGADLSVFGLSAELYRWAWNRAGDDEVTLRGELPLADWWRQIVRIGARG
jgi:uncharacterized protein (TIGR03083 family)